jgi:hypothetical protein
MRTEPYTVKEAADVLHVSDKTIRRMIDRGNLKEQGKDEHGRILISAVSVDAVGQVSKVSRQESKAESRQPVEVFLPTVLEQDTASSSTVQQLALVLMEQSKLIAELGERAGRAEERADQAEERATQLEQELQEAHAEVSKHVSRQEATPQPEPTPPLAEQPATRAPWWKRLFGPI